ncbi:MAG: FKBP-type peptidyl-prolyl cis-trans isomerase [Polyangiales bacterium]
MPSPLLHLALSVVIGASAACSQPGAAEPATDKAPGTQPVSSAPPATHEPSVAPETTPPADAVQSPSGLASKVLAAGSGDAHPTLHDQVRVEFTAWNAKGEQTDSSQKRGGPVTYPVTGVIAGWTEALTQMRVGERRRLWIPDKLVYPGRPGYPRSLVIFDLVLLEIIPGVQPLAAPPDVAAAPRDVIKTGSGLAYKLLEHGQGADKPGAWDRVTIDYTGWTANGEMFVTSRGQTRAAVFDVQKVIPGWQELLPKLTVGDRARVWVPEVLAYKGRGGQPKGTLVYEIGLVAVEHKPAPPQPPQQLSAAPKDAHKTASGLAYRMLKSGEGKRPSAGQHVELRYAAWTSDGALFDSSVAKGDSATVPVGRVIAGWGEGLQLMAEGSHALFWIPEPLAYAGKPGGPRGPLVYDVELLKVVD